MDVVFNCIHCDQELSIDASGAGSEIDCPTCGGKVTIPQLPADALPGADAEVALPGAKPAPGAAIKTSAAAKEEHHFTVPMRDKPADPLIQKPKPALDTAAKEGIHLRIKTIRHAECVEVGHDRFDEIVSKFLDKIGQDNLVSVNPITYEHFDIGSQKIMADFGVMILYKG